MFTQDKYVLEMNHTHWIIYDSSMKDKIKKGLSKLSYKERARIDTCMDKIALALTDNIMSSLFVAWL